MTKDAREDKQSCRCAEFAQRFMFCSKHLFLLRFIPILKYPLALLYHRNSEKSSNHKDYSAKGKIIDLPATIFDRIPHSIESFGETPIKFRETLNHLAKLWQEVKKNGRRMAFQLPAPVRVSGIWILRE